MTLHDIIIVVLIVLTIVLIKLLFGVSEEEE